jgi:DNA invertase Pin-like site-specific DNA recombinase
MNPTDHIRSTPAPSAHKIRPRHLDRLAVIYVRQSTHQQVLSNRESADLQYQLGRRAIEYGWAESRVLVIDEDQGMSGQSIEGRLGFQRLLAEASLGHVGIVFGREMSRLARSCKDWHQLLELCALFQILLADADGVYDPTDPNDRILLGLRGMMSEAELHVLRSRLLQGKLNKARRGELFGLVPIGYVRPPEGGVALDPDEQVQTVVRLIFQKVAELGSARQAHAYLLAHDIRIGVRSYRGPNRGTLTWRWPRLSTFYDMLRHPFYAGAYVYGRCLVNRVGRVGGKPGRRAASPDEWVALIRDRVPAYITWEQYEENRRRMAANDKGRLPTKNGQRATTLLNRLVWCGRCGRVMGACNTHEVREPRYACAAGLHEKEAPGCQTLTAIPVDQLVGSLVLEAVQPVALELSLQAAEHAKQDRDRLHAVWCQKLERAQYEADRARRQFDLAEPENRLVTRELERRWEECLSELRKREEDYSRFQVELPRQLSPAERERIRALAADLPALWASPTTCSADKRAIVRLLIERVELARRGGTEMIDVVIHWRGGAIGRYVVRQRVRGYRDLDRFAELRARIINLRKQKETSPQIAAVLNAEGFVMPRGNAFTACTVRRLCRQLGLTERPSEEPLPTEHEWWLPRLASELGLARSVLYRWQRAGYILARRRTSQPSGWIIWADAGELTRLRELRAYEESHRGEPVPGELATLTRPGSQERNK